MNDDGEIEAFAERLREEIERASQENDDGSGGSFEEDEFTRYMLDILADAGEVDDYTICYHKKNRLKLNAYQFNEDEDILDLFVSIYSKSVPPETIGKGEVETAFRKVQGFFDASVKGYHKKGLEETAPAYDAARLIYEAQKKRKILRVRLFVFTDGLSTLGVKESEDIDGIAFSFHVWDLRRTYRCKTSGQQREIIEIDFRQQYGQAIPCLATVNCGNDFDACVAMIPGPILAKIYADYGSRLLERNVRSFLQLRGKINKGIKETIVNNPERFLAYNNGISATADDVKFDARGGVWSIVSVRNFQIVNGGQTTASLYYAHKRYKADLSRVYVQAKLSIIKPELVEEIVPKISRFANSQNKISDADFFANDAFHTKIESFSRTVWAPAAGATQRQTQWYYERARGQYVDEKSRSKKSVFESTYPLSQMFTKTDLAKFENIWDQLPHVVSRGAQKNFREFTVRLGSQPDLEIDENYFKCLIAKAILFRRAEAIVKAQKFAGYRAQIVNYTLAYLFNRSGSPIDLSSIWKSQKLPANLEGTIAAISTDVHKCISSPPDGQNVTEWCKKESCWKAVQSLEIAL